jgi:hypothetical protein
MVNRASNLLAQGSTQYNGEVGCLVQNIRSWVITGFNLLPAGSNVFIVGYIDMPNSYGNIGTGEVISYNNTHPTNIRANGFIIDYVSANFGLYVRDTLSMNIRTEITME